MRSRSNFPVLPVGEARVAQTGADGEPPTLHLAASLTPITDSELPRGISGCTRSLIVNRMDGSKSRIGGWLVLRAGESNERWCTGSGYSRRARSVPASRDRRDPYQNLRRNCSEGAVAHRLVRGTRTCPRRWFQEP